VKYAKYGTMVLMLAFLVGFSTPRAMAQEAFKGTFDLQSETYWGPTLLAPGHYTITMGQDPTQRVRLVRLEGDGVRAYILAGPATPEETSAKSKLRLENIHGAYVVRHLDDGIYGQSYVFPVSKNVRMKVERANATSPSQVTVPVSAGGSD
jgi:hypothetical protein